MLTLEEAVERILNRVRPLPREFIRTEDCHGRFACEAIRSAVDLPIADNSAMDGYAVRAEDVQGTRPDAPVELRQIGRAAAGEVFAGEIIPGTCVRVFTGSPLPKGCDAVVMQEDTRSETAGTVHFLDKAAPWENVRFRGEDLKLGDALVEVGEMLTPGRIGLLAACGVGEVLVGRRARAGLLATGSELVEAGTPLSPGKLYESNRAGLGASLTRLGCAVQRYPLVADSLEATRAALEQAFAENDVVITSGGVSVGDFDFVKPAFEAIGGELNFWRVAIKPGKPFVFGERQGKFLFGLPGNPVSAMVTFQLLVRPALLKMMGAVSWAPPSVLATLASPLVNHGDRRHFMRVHLDTEGNVRSAGGQASHLLRALAEANGLVDVPPNTNLAAGSVVRVLRLD